MVETRKVRLDGCGVSRRFHSALASQLPAIQDPASEGTDALVHTKAHRPCKQHAGLTTSSSTVFMPERRRLFAFIALEDLHVGLLDAAVV